MFVYYRDRKCVNMCRYIYRHMQRRGFVCVCVCMCVCVCDVRVCACVCVCIYSSTLLYECLLEEYVTGKNLQYS